MPSLTSLQHALSPEVLVGLTDDSNSGLPDLGVVGAAIAAIDAQVRGSVAGTLALQDGPLPPVLDDIVLTLVIERLYERRREVPPAAWTDRASRARLLLDEIASGSRPVDGAVRRGRAVLATHCPEDRAVSAEVLGNL